MIKHPRRESSEFKDQFNIAGISAVSADISWSVRVSYMIGSVVDKKTDKDCNVEGQTARL